MSWLAGGGVTKSSPAFVRRRNASLASCLEYFAVRPGRAKASETIPRAASACVGRRTEPPGPTPSLGGIVLASSWAKSTKNVFLRKFGVRERTFCISPPPGRLFGLCFKVTARTNNGNPGVLFPQCYKPHLANWQPKKMCLNSTFFRYCARSPHRATKPSRGWLRVGVSKPQFILAATVAACVAARN